MLRSDRDTATVFSMVALADFARLGVLRGVEALLPSESVPVIPLDWPELEQALPDSGLPRGVVELAAIPFTALAFQPA